MSKDKLPPPVHIWDDGVYGLVFDGRDVRLNDEPDFITYNSKLFIVGRTESRRTDDAVDFLSREGYRVESVYKVHDEITFKTALTSIKSQCDSDDLIVLADGNLGKKYAFLLKENGLKYQLYSMMQLYFTQIKPKLFEVYNLLEDSYSKEVFTNVLDVRFKISPFRSLYSYFSPDHYFDIPEMNVRDQNDVFVDCGAFVGDVIEKYINKRQGIFKRIYAFEPNDVAYNALIKRKKRLSDEWAIGEDQIVCYKCGVGKHTTKAKLSSGIMGEHIIGSQLIETDGDEGDTAGLTFIRSLDEVLTGERVTFIKTDVEGYELDLLMGAQEIIKKHKPSMAISIYHKLTDYYELALYIKQLAPEYKFKIRHHSTNFEETVLYAYI